MALPLLAGLAIRTVAQYTMRYGVPAARKAYQAYIKKNKPKNPTKVTEMFKNKTVTNAGNKFKKTKEADKAASKKITEKLGTKKSKKEELGYEGLPKSTGERLRKINEAEEKARKLRGTVAGRKALDKKTKSSKLKKAAGIGVGTIAVSAAVNKISDSSSKAKASTTSAADKKKRDEAKRKKELKQKQKDRANQRMNQANPNVQTSVRSGGFEAKRDKPVLGSSKNIRYGSGRGTRDTTFEDKDKNVVRDSFGKAVKSKSGKVRTRDTFKSSAFMGGGMPMKKKMMSAGGNMKKKGYAGGGVGMKKGYAAGGVGMKKGYAAGGVGMKKKMMSAGGTMKKKMMSAGGMPMAKDPKTGKMIPKFAMDGVGKMAKGGNAMKMGYMKKGGVAKKKMMAGGGMSKKKGYAAGGMSKKKGYAAGGRVTMKRSTARGK